MPAKSKKQKKLFGIARGIQEGKVSPSYSPAAAKIAKGVSPKKVKEFAKTKKSKTLPKRSFVYKKNY